jgi:guanine deaminase
MTDQDFMRLVIKAARHGVERGQTPFGACLVKGQDVVSLHIAAWSISDVTAHAEMQVIRDACEQLDTRDLSSCVIYSSCAPCVMCFGACHWAGISRIVYGVSLEDSIGVGLGNLPVSPEAIKQLGHCPVEITGGVLVDEIRALFTLWAERNRPSRRGMKLGSAEAEK